MVIYEVTLQVEPSLAIRLEEHMRRSHIPAIFASKCFRSIRLVQASPARFRVWYQADTQAQLDRYLRDHALKLRAEFQAEFPTGVILTRETWIQREVWE